MVVQYIYDEPSRPPRESQHWLQLPEAQETDIYLGSLEETKERFQWDLDAKNARVDAVAQWSCLLGYCEALTTHKQDRFSIYPIPYSALERLVETRFTPPIVEMSLPHLNAAQTISNWVWGKVKSKANVKDELHANSIYTVLQPQYHVGKSLDCFGAALVTVIALRRNGRTNSALTLSEDHAYESHGLITESGNNNDCTCEVAIPGNTKQQQAKRGRPITDTFHKASRLTPETSWLYMAKAPVVCNTDATILAAAIANINAMINCTTARETYSRPLLLLKRELLWILYDRNTLQQFPFGLCELGWSEENVTSTRGEEIVSVPGHNHMTKMESLYHQAIQCSKDHYFDLQVYPYCYLGYFHKDAPEEYRATLALAAFAEAARVASTYQYEWGDSLQLTKVMTTIATYIVREILMNDDVTARVWEDVGNSIAAAQQLAMFYDHLLVWEERGGEQFLSILQKGHKYGIARAFPQFSLEVRQAAYTKSFLNKLHSQRIKRIPLSQAEKLVISDESHLSLILEDGNFKRSSRKRKEIKP